MTPKRTNMPRDPASRRHIEERCKFLASIMLLGTRTDRIILPQRDEWIGLNLLERDGGLERW